MSKHILTIKGMSCGHCVKHVKNALSELEGVKVLKVDLGKAEIEGNVSEEKLRELLDEEGFELESVN